MNGSVVSKTCSSTSFRELLRSEYKTFEEQKNKQKDSERSEYSSLEKELQRKFDELFGNDN